MLFEVPKNKTRLEIAMEKHGIETHDCDLAPGEQRWIALLRPKAVEMLSSYGVTKDATLFDMFAGYCRLLDESGLAQYGESEEEAVLELCRQNNIPIVL